MTAAAATKTLARAARADTRDQRALALAAASLALATLMEIAA
jgi:hypothetical protein